MPQVETRTEYRDRVTHDTTIVEKEKVLYEKGDTIYLTITKNVYRVSVQRDTILVRDSILVPYEVIKVEEVPRKKDGLGKDDDAPRGGLPLCWCLYGDTIRLS